jgi:hypothetical protein
MDIGADDRAPRGEADDVALVASASGRLHAAITFAALDAEEVWLGEVGGAGLVPLGEVGSMSFRPALAAMGEAIVAVACDPAGALVGGLIQPDQELERWRLDRAAAPWQVELAVDAAGQVWIAVELRRAGDRWIEVGLLDPGRGRVQEVARVGGGATWARWPALAPAPGEGCRLAWCEGRPRGVAGVMVSSIDGRGLGAPLCAAEEGDAPVLALAPDGSSFVAWHRGGAAVADGQDPGASLVRTLAVARLDRTGAAVAASPPPPLGPGGLEARGKDQGWELPAAVVDAGGSLWLAGRSSHGHQLARLSTDGRWSQRVSLCEEAWGGRGRRMALALRGREVWLGRRAPAGVDIARCPEPSGDAPAVAGRHSASARPARASRRDGEGVLFGDLHQHTVHSDGCGSAEDRFIAARDRRGLDFAAVTDHDRFCRRALGPATWRTLCQVADDFDEPGRFAALPGYEFTGARHPGPGHKCVYFGSRVPDRVPEKDVDAILAMVRELGGIAVPHHVGWTGGDFSHHDPTLQPVWEIVSVHGCYEADGSCPGRPPRDDCVIPGQFVKDALAAGLRFGFIASTDCHGLDWHHGIAQVRNPLTAGLACVVGAEPTRDSVLAALRARRAYATSGERILAHAELDGAPMGSDLPEGTRGELHIRVRGTAAVSRVLLVTPLGESVLAGGSSPDVALRTRIPEPDRPGFWLYARIEQANGGIAWLSPFWIG